MRQRVVYNKDRKDGVQQLPFRIDGRERQDMMILNEEDYN
jgi:hypothetical protein